MYVFLKKYFAVILILFAFQQPNNFAQPFYFRHYQVENGLSNNAAITCLQDKKGFIWFGTKDGLNRFDGYRFKVFRNEPDDSTSIGSNFIHCLYEDHYGVLWVGTENGLYSYNEKTESFSLLKPSANAPVADIKMDAKGNLWYLQALNLYKWEQKNSRSQAYPATEYFEASSICIAKDGSLWASSSNGYLHHYDAAMDNFKKFDVFTHSANLNSRWIEKIVSAKNGDILIGTADGAKIYNTEKNDYVDLLRFTSDKSPVFVRNFLENNDNELWIASESGIYLYNKQTGSVINLRKTYNDPFSISDNAVYTFCKDDEGGIWAGTYFGGINYFPKQHISFKKFFPRTGENSLSGNVVREIHEDKNSNLWIGTEDAGLDRYNPNTGIFTTLKPTGAKTSISYSNIHGLFTRDDELWIGTFEHGLDILDLKNNLVKKHYDSGSGYGQMKSNFIFCITQTSSGKILIGTTRGAYYYNKSGDNFPELEGMPLYNWYSYLLEDDEGNLWAATYGNGVNFYNPKKKQIVNYRYRALDNTTIASDRVNSIYEDSKHNLWFATEGGLSKFDKEKNQFKTYNTGNGFPSDFILSILEDSKKNLWLSTSKGLVNFNPQTEEVQVFTTSNGLLNDQFNFNSAYKDATGCMYFGTVKGMVSFIPESFTTNNVIPPVFITGFQVFNKELNVAQKGSPLQNSITFTDKIELSHDQSSISIDFAALSYTAPEMSEYAYKLDGIDKNWTYLKRNRKVYFTDLKPGNYVFKVKASNSSGLWNNRETTLTIVILPPWWASNLAYSLYVMAVIVMIALGIRMYHNRVEEKNRRKFELLELAKEKEITEAKIEFFTNVAHEIKTPLTLIKAPLEKVIKKAENIPEIMTNLKIMDRNTNRLIELTNQLLDFRQTEMEGFSLNFSTVNVSEILEEAYNDFKQLAEQRNIKFQMKLPAKPLYASVDVDAFTKIVYNLFSNAVKYAAGKADVSMQVKNRENYFTIETRNDGYFVPVEMREKIFDPFFRLKENQGQKGTGIGLALSRSLAQLHKGSIIMKDNAEGLNVFCFNLPIRQQNESNIANDRQAVS